MEGKSPMTGRPTRAYSNAPAAKENKSVKRKSGGSHTLASGSSGGADDNKSNWTTYGEVVEMRTVEVERKKGRQHP